MAGHIVQAGYNVDDSGGGSTTIAVTLTGVAAGNTIVVIAGWGDGDGSVTGTCSDGAPYSSTPRARVDVDGIDSQVFYLENVGSGSHTITVTCNFSISNRRIRAVEISGLQTSSSLDQSTNQQQVGPGTGTDAVSSGITTPTTNANDFIVGLSQCTSQTDPGSGTISAGTGYTISGANVILALESKSVSWTGTQTATFTRSLNLNFTTHVLAFKELASYSYNYENFPKDKIARAARGYM